MSSDQLTPATIPDQSFPVNSTSDDESVSATGQGSTATNSLSPEVIPGNTLPQPVIAMETISQTIDTQSKRIKGSYQFDQLGAIQIGQYQNGVSGQVVISPDGIVATNQSGEQTFALDGTSGDATFLGTVQAGSLISGDLTLGGNGNGNGVFDLMNANGKDIIHMDNTGLTVYNPATTDILATISNLGITVFDESFIINSSSVGGTVAGIGADGSGNTFFTNGSFGTGVLNIGFPTVNVTNNLNCHALKVNGTTKTAIVPTKKGHRALYTNESPEVWFMDFAQDEGSIDPMFLEVTAGEMKIIECKDGSIQVWRRRKGFLETRFEEKTEEEFIRNNEFWSVPLVD